jgi:hypothetical protein
VYSLGIPKALPDELIDSYILRFERLTGHRSKALADLQRNAALRTSPFRPVGGRGNVWEGDATLDLSRQEKIRLSMLELYAPAAATQNDASGREFDKSYHLWELKENLAHCYMCTAEDTDRFGYSYWRRQPQVRCNIYCPKHGFTIVDRCNHCGACFNNDTLPAVECRVCKNALGATIDPKSILNSESDVFDRISRCVDGLLSGSFRGTLRLNLLQSEVRSTVKCRTPNSFNNVAHQICQLVSLERLRDLDLDPSRKPMFGWPAIYLSGGWGQSSSTLESVLVSVFGESQSLDGYWGSSTDSQKHGRGKPYLLDRAFLRALYTSSSWGEANDRLCLSSMHVRKMVAPYPGLKRRIEAFRKRRSSAASTTSSSRRGELPK